MSSLTIEHDVVRWLYDGCTMVVRWLYDGCTMVVRLLTWVVSLV